MSRSKLFTTIILVVLVTFLTKVDSFLPRAYNKDIQCSSKVMMQSRDSVEPISVQYNVKKASSVLLPFLATLLTTGLVASAAGTGAAGFLTEPTAEFKDEEKKVADFKAQQNKIRKSWDEIIAKLEVSDSPLVTEACIKDLTAVLTKYNSGIPSGVKKLELVKTIRAKKYVMVGKKQKILPTWSKESEIAYQVTNSLYYQVLLFLLN